MEEHDSSYRKLFSFPQMVKDLLVGYVHEDWISELDFDKMEAIETSFVSENLRTREADVIWRIKWRDRWLYVYVLIEMQSRVEPMMAVRLLAYTSLLYQNLISNNQLTPDGRLPPILPITIYNGSTPWTGAKTMTELIEPVPKSLQRYQPQFEYFLLDESQVTTQSTTPNLITALIDIEMSLDEKHLGNAVERLDNWLDQSTHDHRRLAKIFIVWLSRSLLPNRFPGVKLSELQSLMEVKDMLAERVTDFSLKWKREGREEGLKEGIEQSEKKVASTLHTVVINLFAEDASLETICRVTGLSKEEVLLIKES